MKRIILSILLTLSISGYSQINRADLIGSWKVSNVESSKDLIDDSAELMMILHPQGTFEISGSDIHIQGIWKLSKSSLIFTGKASDDHIEQTNEMRVRSVSEDTLIVVIEEEGQVATVTFVKTS